MILTDFLMAVFFESSNGKPQLAFKAIVMLRTTNKLYLRCEIRTCTWRATIESNLVIREVRHTFHGSNSLGIEIK